MSNRNEKEVGGTTARRGVGGGEGDGWFVAESASQDSSRGRLRGREEEGWGATVAAVTRCWGLSGGKIIVVGVGGVRGGGDKK